MYPEYLLSDIADEQWCNLANSVGLNALYFSRGTMSVFYRCGGNLCSMNALYAFRKNRPKLVKEEVRTVIMDCRHLQHAKKTLKQKESLIGQTGIFCRPYHADRRSGHQGCRRYLTETSYKTSSLPFYAKKLCLWTN